MTEQETKIEKITGIIKEVLYLDGEITLGLYTSIADDLNATDGQMKEIIYKVNKEFGCEISVGYFQKPFIDMDINTLLFLINEETTKTEKLAERV